MNKKSKYISLSLIFVLFMFMLIGCSKQEKYTKFQNAYFEISRKAESNQTFSKENLEKIIGSQGNKASDINTYLFNSEDESIMIGLNKENKLDIIQYEKPGKIKLVNSLVDDTNIGGYTKGFSSEIKLDNLESQKNLFSSSLNSK
ncbi:hypothetical protein WS9_013025 [Paraclostridium sordellii 8483]|uniref:hypothetical protein n=1 Tax=Paraclostridium sordellii TaxID=1505 RepID=UPI0002E60572|nr:hypothetical protein [Paeniclostridium sordellii]TAN65026.1 hypothetical protein WS9_013025 [Paeniclostridium sordellii 8483]